jgi:hypothetical protein
MSVVSTITTTTVTMLRELRFELNYLHACSDVGLNLSVSRTLMYVKHLCRKHGKPFPRSLLRY